MSPEADCSRCHGRHVCPRRQVLQRQAIDVNTGTETILIAEDHESIREMARQTLVNLGYRVLSAADGEEALRLCAEDTPAIAITSPMLSSPPKAIYLRKPPCQPFELRNRTIFNIDTYDLQCYKPLKEKLFGGESPNELLKATRVRPQTCLAGQAC